MALLQCTCIYILACREISMAKTSDHRNTNFHHQVMQLQSALSINQLIINQSCINFDPKSFICREHKIDFAIIINELCDLCDRTCFLHVVFPR